ncbi:MAG: co-chaperone GroES [Armatimonadetes bacterium]|nr:co-chaperone GroES [Armatimonadota bacterium]
MNLRPLGDRVIVKPIREDITTRSGIVLPETAEKERPEKGEIIAVGPGKTLENGQKIALDLKIGDKILFTKYGPTEIKVNDEELLIISESDIMAVIEE